MEKSDSQKLLSATIRAELANHRVQSLPLKGLRAAAVLIPLRLYGGELKILLTRRTDHLNHHAGEISFPGGGIDATDPDDWAAALRETHEEIGVSPTLVEPLGQLDDCYSIHGYRVSCYVGMLPEELDFLPNPSEISELIELPLSTLNDPLIYHQEDWEHQGRSVPVDFFTLEEHVIWGMTGGILKQLLQRFAPLL